MLLFRQRRSGAGEDCMSHMTAQTRADAVPSACPQARLSRAVAESPQGRVLDLDIYIPHLLGAVHNPLSAGASAEYLATFGLGVVEWRVLSTLMIEPSSPAARICEVFSGDKAAVSRALKRLEAEGHAVFTASQSDPRRKTWALTRSGQALHARMLDAALAREARLIAAVDPDDLEVFLKVMRQLRDNATSLKTGQLRASGGA
jgi:DNA-binding MarR family transcriptional regulator